MGNVFEIYLKLLSCACVPMLLTILFCFLKKKTRFVNLPYAAKQAIIGVLFGFAAIFGTEFGVDIGGATANARDAAPLCAGLLFGAPAGIIAGIIGGVERWFAATWGAGMYSRLACSVSTIFAGFFAAFLRAHVFDNKRPNYSLAFVTGGVMEIIHMTVLFLTHLRDPEHALEIVKICTVPMVVCNGISILISVAAAVIITSDRQNHSDRKRNISQRFQTPMLIVVVIAYLLSTVFVFFLQTYTAQENASKIMTLNIEDVKQEILSATDQHLVTITREIAEDLNRNPDCPLEDLTQKYNVADIWIINRDGIITQATDNNVGYDMHSDADKPKEEQQSSAFLVLLTGETTEYVQEYRSLAADASVGRKLAGVALENGGFVQAGFDAEMFQTDLENQIRNDQKRHRIGENGHIVILDRSMKVISNSEDVSDFQLILSEISESASDTSAKPFKASINGLDSLCLAAETEGYFIVATMPENEIYMSRNAMTYINSYMEILVFAALFILTYLIIRKVVVNNLNAVNKSLEKITGGQLETVVKVNSSEEFFSLSNAINSTVDTLKQYISEAEKRFDKELALAKDIQAAVLPSIFPAYPSRKDFNVYASMYTAKEVGGDFYDFYLLDIKHLVILIADVSGKGIPAAMFMMTAKTMLKNLTQTRLSIEEVFSQANDKLCEGNDAGMFVTAWMGILNTETGHLEFANAGHNPPLLFRKDGTFEYLKSRAGFVLAGMEGMQYIKQEIDLSPGDRIFLYTDGVTEATDSNNELFGEERLQNYLNEHCSATTEEMLTGVKMAIDQFVGDAEQFDDITMLLMDYYGTKPKAQLQYQEFDASDTGFETAMDFIRECLEKNDADPNAIMQISISFEEMFINVAHYAYSQDAPGKALVGFGLQERTAIIEIRDSGLPFNPLEKEDPDLTLPAEDRPIGGLGILMTKKMMDELSYEYSSGQNILTMKKKI